MKRPLAWIVCAALLVLGLVWFLRAEHDDVNSVAQRVASAPGETNQNAAELTTDAERAREAQRDDALTHAKGTANAAESSASGTDRTASPTLSVLCVEQETGAPRAGVIVAVREADPKLHGVVRVGAQRGSLTHAPVTGANGRAEFDLPPGRPFALTATTNDPTSGPTTSAVEKQLEPFTAGEHRELRIALLTRADRVFHALVRARETAAPIAHARVDVSGDSPIFTDAQGRFAVAYKSWIPPLLDIHAPGWSQMLVYPVADARAPESAFVIELERSASLSVTLRGIPGDLRADARLSATVWSGRLVSPGQRQPMRFGHSEDPVWEAPFDPAGRAVLDDLPAGAGLTVAAKANERVLYAEPAELVLAPGESRVLEWSVAGGARVLVRVLERDDTPIAGIELWLAAESDRNPFDFSVYDESRITARATTDERGQAVFAGVRAGSWRVGLRAVPDDQPNTHAARPVHFTLAANSADLALELRVDRGLHITGTVRDPSGKLAEKASVIGLHESGAGVWAQTDADGAFTLEPLSAGAYELFAAGFPSSADSEHVTVRAGASGVELKLRAGATLRGRVVDAQTGVGCRAMLRPTAMSGPAGIFTRQSSADDGTFVLDGLTPDVYAVCAVTEDGRVGIVRGVSTAASRTVDDVVVSVGRGAKLRVSAVADHGTAYATVTCEGAGVPCDELVAGATSTWAVPAGALHIEVTFRATMKRTVQDVTLAVGEERELVFRADD